jgi:secreted PhoX family phosphatase
VPDPSSLEPSNDLSFEEVVDRRYGRRKLLKGALATGGAAAVAPFVLTACEDVFPYDPDELTFEKLAPSSVDDVVVPAGFAADVLISWGDPVVPGAPAFDITDQSAAAQELQCGFNHDFVAYRPLPDWTSDTPDHGLLWINHEYTDSAMMFEGYTSTPAQVAVELAAHGGTVVEVTRAPDGTWSYDPDSSSNRRITATTPMALTGPAAGDPRLATSADPTGASVLGMLNNCGGGVTPWGTILTAEENFDQYFGNFATMPAGFAKAAGQTYGLANGASGRRWETVDPRFDLAAEPNEVLRFGWIVEVDPYDPESTPRKHTALGRFKHEAAAGALGDDGRYVVYSGDDQANQCIYKFVSDGTFDPNDREANFDLLTSGTLYAAKFHVDGTGEWLPLTFGQGALVAPAFADQVDVLVRSRIAAAALGATKMARPEDVEVSPITGKVYCVMTGNSSAERNAANPRTGTSISGQGLGHVIEISEWGDQAATGFNWEIVLLCGEPDAVGIVTQQTSPLQINLDPNGVTYYKSGHGKDNVSPVARVDNAAFDSRGFLYLSTDGQPSALHRNLSAMHDQILGMPVEGNHMGFAKSLLFSPRGCEVASLFFTPDDRSLFVSIQHPGVDNYTWTSPVSSPSYTEGTFAAPGSTWNTTPAIPGVTPGVPRPAVVVVRRLDGREVGYGAVDAPPAGNEVAAAGLPSGPAGLVAGAALVGGLLALRNRVSG